MSRYDVYHSSDPHKYYVYDNLKGQLVLSRLAEGTAHEMAADLNQIHENAPAPAGVPEEVLGRMHQQILVSEAAASRWAHQAAACLEQGRSREAASIELAMADRQQIASDVRCVLSALGALRDV